MDEIQDTINEKKVEADKNSVKEKNDESKNVIKFCNEQEKEKIKNSKENELKSMNDKNNCIMGKFCRYDTRSPIRVQNFKFFDRIFDPVKFIPAACLNLKKILK
ncbi:hypothetical protein PVAND_016175 [Polypedilum vanderplanki]|uniref:Uncharacterized protein n=1 Tax=Polypedilum vanderplanki TaxID=319348 RepID=A0A9J6BFG4_POLVA|nr:hypothetical protein PVAND_016175 [Polypedilum vanderplanki]